MSLRATIRRMQRMTSPALEFVAAQDNAGDRS
jgi:hypothetical protein